MRRPLQREPQTLINPNRPMGIKRPCRRKTQSPLMRLKIHLPAGRSQKVHPLPMRYLRHFRMS